MRWLAFILSLSCGVACRHESHALSAPTGLDLNLAPKGKTFTEQGEYLIDSNDVVSIQVDKPKDITGIYKVAPNGTISLPQVGLLRVKGLTENQLRESLVFKLRPASPMARVTISLTQANSFVVYFSGKVVKPGSYKLETRTSLLQGIAMAGGPLANQATRVIIVREGSDGIKKRFETTYAKVRDGQGSLDNFLLERGDLVMID